MNRDADFKNQLFFFILFAVLLVLGYWLLHPFLGTIAFSLMVVIILKPLFNVVNRWVGGRSSFAATLTILLFFAAIIVPIGLAIGIVTEEIESLVQAVESVDGDYGAFVDSLQTEIDSLVAGTPLEGRFQISDETGENVRAAVL
ncbi:MAG: AI-2E family transporter, partial [Caldilineaceae bacterium]|nr:AI-2E family transporter [Caldilineaceae bacterium]